MAPTGPSITLQLGTGEKGIGLDDKGRRKLKQPRGIRLCADGALLVADYGNNCVLRFKPGDERGTVLAGEPGKLLPTVDPMKDIDKPLTLPAEEGLLLKQPSDVCEEPAAAPGGAAERGILVLDTEEGSVQRFVGLGARGETLVPQGGKSVHKSIGDPASVKNPRGVAIAEDGAIVVCDTWSHRVLRFPPPGSPEAGEKPTVLAGSSNSWGKTSEKLAFPSCVAFAADGALLVADTNNHRVQRFAPGELEGTTVAGSAEGRRGKGLGELDMPTGICVDPRDGSFLVADRSNARVLRFPADSRAGAEGSVVAGPEALEWPWGVCVGPTGAVFVSDERRAVVLKFEEPGAAGAGAAAKFAPPPRGQQPPPSAPEAPPPALGPLDLD